MGCSYFSAVVDSAAINIDVQVLVWACVFISLGLYLGVELLGRVTILHLTF